MIRDSEFESGDSVVPVEDYEVAADPGTVALVAAYRRD